MASERERAREVPLWVAGLVAVRRAVNMGMGTDMEAGKLNTGGTKGTSAAGTCREGSLEAEEGVRRMGTVHQEVEDTAVAHMAESSTGRDIGGVDLQASAVP